jgi:hypothetical protein
VEPAYERGHMTANGKGTVAGLPKPTGDQTMTLCVLNARYRATGFSIYLLGFGFAYV